jgi:hypothetical protein
MTAAATCSVISLATQLGCSRLQLRLCTAALLQPSGLANCKISLYVAWQISVWSNGVSGVLQHPDG